LSITILLKRFLKSRQSFHLDSFRHVFFPSPHQSENTFLLVQKDSEWSDEQASNINPSRSASDQRSTSLLLFGMIGGEGATRGRATGPAADGGGGDVEEATAMRARHGM